MEAAAKRSCRYAQHLYGMYQTKGPALSASFGHYKVRLRHTESVFLSAPVHAALLSIPAGICFAAAPVYDKCLKGNRFKKL